MTTVVAHPRLHFGLLDLGHATHRIFGGVGAAIEQPETKVTVERSSSASVSGVDLSEDLVRDLLAALARLGDLRGEMDPVRVHVDAAPTAHIGLGSKTSVILAVLAAANVELDLGLTQRELQVLSGRGGTSGVGVHTFFEGGLIVDAGHRAIEPRHYRPSSAGPPGQIAPILVSLEMPLDWDVSLLLVEGIRWSADAERRFFLANTPIDDGEVDRAIAIVCLDVAASVAERDLASFASSIRSLQAVGFKQREIEAQPSAVRLLLEALQATPSVAAGMSSVGPLVYAVYRRADAVSRAAIDRAAGTFGASVVATTQFVNHGYGTR